MKCTIEVNVGNPFPVNPEREIVTMVEYLLAMLKVSEVKPGREVNIFDAFANRIGHLKIEEKGQ